MKNNGFTLAEVLITLAIIGLIAALTLPALMTDSRYQLVSSRVSKFVSVTEEAARAYAGMNGEITAENLDSTILKLPKDSDETQVKLPRTYQLRDGSKLEVLNANSNACKNFIPLSFGDSGSENSSLLPSDFQDLEKYGSASAVLHFYHNVSGLKNLDEYFVFIMTNKGYIAPSACDECAMAMFDSKNEKNPWRLTRDMASDKTKACYKDRNVIDNSDDIL